MTCSQEFPEGSRRREAVISKITVFFNSRLAAAEDWDIALLRLALSDTVTFGGVFYSCHAVRCWHNAVSSQCECIDAFTRTFMFEDYHSGLSSSILVRRTIAPLVTGRRDNHLQDTLDVMQHFLPLSATSPHGVALSPFIYLYVAFLPLTRAFRFMVLTFSSEELTFGFSTCSHSALPTQTCTPSSGLCVQPLCHSCPSEAMTVVPAWCNNSYGKRNYSTTMLRYGYFTGFLSFFNHPLVLSRSWNQNRLFPTDQVSGRLVER